VDERVWQRLPLRRGHRLAVLHLDRGQWQRRRRLEEEEEEEVRRRRACALDLAGI